MRTFKAILESNITKQQNGCWVWKNKTHYGKIRMLGYSIPAHRFMYEFYNGEIPPDLLLRHTCDNPPCVNPEHLIPGTPLENRHDQIIRMRDNRLLTNEEATEILLNKDGLMAKDLAKRYGVNPQVVSGILNKKTYRHINIPANKHKKPPKKEKIPRRNLTLLERYKDKIVHEDGCWYFLGKHHRGKHAVVWINGKSTTLKRAIYEEVYSVKLIPKKGIWLSCNNTQCINPEHMNAQVISP